MTVTEIKMPKEIKSIEQFNAWRKSLHGYKQDFEIVMKRRPNFSPYDFTVLENGKIHYLIDDSVSSGRARIESFNKIFTFRIRTYN